LHTLILPKNRFFKNKNSLENQAVFVK